MDKAPRSVDAIVESRMRRWLVERGRERASPAEPDPVITVSRQFGARGAAVARIVAERMEFSYWNRELLAAMARHAHVDPAVLAPFDEHHHSVLDDPMRGPMPATTVPGQADYAHELSMVTRYLVLRGRAVLVGRGLAFLIEPARSLRVRVICPLDQRIQGLAEREQLALETARATIEYADRDRRAFVRDLFGCEVDDPTAYDLIVSTARMSLEAAAEIVVAAYRARFPTRATSKG